MTITAAADGSALGNPGPAGWAWFIDENTWRAGGWPHGTNNMGELMAVLDLLEATAADADEHLVVLCDSQYVINAVTRWMPGWKRKGWRKKDGKPVLNVDLLQGIDRALAGRSVEFEWVKGHSGHAMNEAADARARAVAIAFSKGQDPPIGPGYRGASGAPSAERPAAPPEPLADDLFSLFDQPAEPGEPPEAAESARATRLDAPTDPIAPAASARSTDPEAALGTDLAQITDREQALLTAAVRSSATGSAALLHPSFSEIGASGRREDREQTLARMALLDGVEAGEFVADEIAPGVVLLEYVTTEPRGRILRSSVWVREGGQWLLRHHQGTPAAVER